MLQLAVTFSPKTHPNPPPPRRLHPARGKSTSSGRGFLRVFCRSVICLLDVSLFHGLSVLFNVQDPSIQPLAIESKRTAGAQLAPQIHGFSDILDLHKKPTLKQKPIPQKTILVAKHKNHHHKTTLPQTANRIPPLFPGSLVDQ